MHFWGGCLRRCSYGSTCNLVLGFSKVNVVVLVYDFLEFVDEPIFQEKQFVACITCKFAGCIILRLYVKCRDVFVTLQRFLVLKPRVCSQLTERKHCKTNLVGRKISSHEVSLSDLVDH